MTRCCYKCSNVAMVGWVGVVVGGGAQRAEGGERTSHRFANKHGMSVSGSGHLSPTKENVAVQRAASLCCARLCSGSQTCPMSRQRPSLFSCAGSLNCQWRGGGVLTQSAFSTRSASGLFSRWSPNLTDGSRMIKRCWKARRACPASRSNPILAAQPTATTPMISQGGLGRGEMSLESPHTLAKFIPFDPTDSRSSLKKTPPTRQKV